MVNSPPRQRGFTDRFSGIVEVDSSQARYSAGFKSGLVSLVSWMVLGCSPQAVVAEAECALIPGHARHVGLVQGFQKHTVSRVHGMDGLWECRVMQDESIHDAGSG